MRKVHTNFGRPGRLFDRKAVLDDVANLAYIVADVREGRYLPHALHQTFDICAPGNIERVNRILDLAISEVEVMLHDCPHTYKRLIRNLIHEYLVTRVFYDWLTIAFPPGLSSLPGGTSRLSVDNLLDIWKEKCTSARIALESALRNITCAFRRPVPPI